MKEDNRHIVYFLGIGGIGMSALARYFNAKGYIVAGYDRTPTPLTKRLEEEGISVHYDDDPKMIPNDIDFVVLTPAIPANSLELNYLKDKNVKIIKRAEVLGMLSRQHKALAVAGTHGKTTTTALVTHILMTANKKLSAFIGGIARNINSNVVIGEEHDELVVMEADEFDHSFLQLSPYVSIVTSVDADHLDIYGDYKHLEDSFNEFVNKTSDEGLVIYHSDLPIKTSKKHITYGLENADLIAENVCVIQGETCFDVKIDEVGLVEEQKKICENLRNLRDIRMRLYGNHNVQNALAAIIMCSYVGVSQEDIKKGLATFKGVQRRFDIRVKTEKHVYVDDYAHHPEEIKAALTTARKVFCDKELTIVFQPHLFTRTRDFMDGFAESLSLADRVILLDIYPARELPIDGVTSAALLEKITVKEKMLCKKEDLLDTIKRVDPELVMTLGAGNIDNFVPQIEKMFNNE